MAPSNLPVAVASAIASSDVKHSQELYQSNMSLDQITKHAAKHGYSRIMQRDFISCAVCSTSPALWQNLIDNGLDLNAHESQVSGDLLSSAIIFKSRGNKYDFAKWLLEQGHRPTPIDSGHEPSAIIWTICVETADMEMLSLLMDYGHDLEECEVGVAAADEGNLEALRLLLDRGVNIEDRDLSWYPFTWKDEPYESLGAALYRACRQGNVDCVELLLERGADALAADLEGKSCLDIAKRRGHEDIVWLLESRGNVAWSFGGFVKRLLYVFF
ncbi:ankyrin [Paraphaeosphaeria sporulosa]|uniref:Ankyrin n=1 Tax=Paraphaeosphaeria sporulosa TaxID=1460663 RepID=A0A177C5M5_9PLEO|nr:ankyrin [Paraphaeosphaeria sporulosa]OAG02027.1 ankyrin [Paraphaeosphaeria sporulosa]